MDEYWRYSDCDIQHSGTAVMVLGGATGHVWMPIAMCQDRDVAEQLAMSLRAFSACKPRNRDGEVG